jgi:hypothetical protein
VIYIAGQVGGEMRQLEFFAEHRDLRDRNWWRDRLHETRSCGRRVRDEDPDESVTLFARITTGVNAISFQVLVGG